MKGKQKIESDPQHKEDLMLAIQRKEPVMPRGNK